RRGTGDFDVAREGLVLLPAGHVGHLDVAGEHFDVERDVFRHLDVEVGLDDVVVLLGPVVVFLVRLDGNAGRGLADLELDVLETVARGVADGVNRDVAAAAPGDDDAAGEVLEPELTAGADLHGAV